jgi:dUTPase
MLSFYKTGLESHLPSRGSRGACGIDLPIPFSLSILPQRKVCIDLLLSVSLPENHFGLLQLRSGISRRTHLKLHAGIIGKVVPLVQVPLLIIITDLDHFPDGDYTGSLQLLLSNEGTETLELRAGESYVQLIPVRYFTGPLIGGKDWTYRSERGESGFGSTQIRERLEQLFADHLTPEDVGDGPSAPAASEEEEAPAE